MIDQIPTEKEIQDVCRNADDADGRLNKKVCASHAIIFTGFDDARRLFFFKNSWDKDWGLNQEYMTTANPKDKTGYGAISYDYYIRFGKDKIIVLK